MNKNIFIVVIKRDKQTNTLIQILHTFQDEGVNSVEIRENKKNETLIIWIYKICVINFSANNVNNDNKCTKV